jgi:hypothetical protein
MKLATTIVSALAFAAAPLAVSAQQEKATLPPVPEVATAGVAQTGAEPLPILTTIPAGAVVAGGVVILAGVVIGVAASDGDDSTTSTVSTN